MSTLISSPPSCPNALLDVPFKGVLAFSFGVLDKKETWAVPYDSTSTHVPEINLMGFFLKGCHHFSQE